MSEDREEERDTPGDVAKDAETPQARARRIILARRSRFMAAALAGVGVGSNLDGCAATDQAPENDESYATGRTGTQVCLTMIAPPVAGPPRMA
ncbi:MAG: hypothetical protein OXU20_41635, partial [Myxococcales bacterium]|nr:hypothetical protein [Myxococcales bacterium]